MREPTRGTSQNFGFRFSGKEVMCLPLPVVEPQKGRHHEQQEELVLLPALSFSAVQFIRSVVSDFLQPHGLQHARPSCPS